MNDPCLNKLHCDDIIREGSEIGVVRLTRFGLPFDSNPRMVIRCDTFCEQLNDYFTMTFDDAPLEERESLLDLAIPALKTEIEKALGKL